MAVPLRIGDIHLIAGAENALGVLETGWLEHRANRRRHVGHDVDRMPVEFGKLLDRLRCKFRGSDIDKDFRVRGLDRHHLGVHRRHADLV